ncbi:alpha/beta fold hydrolase [Rhodococcus erythropolis]|uniref:alpha/beta fold hydrolase n=1 Tax=Rhodococcus erythropolis TaxID=1833 RepID=UPI001E3E80D5|nr:MULTISPECIES: alpha/beta fold hydrolase [Rhodococcus erythropolis group]MCD2105896.1 alpha/beta fold hydrolase [Rhodococcus qingshengii]MCZ4523499.1 alpha/beta fold hydrolase [Rhodococcus erythropolis]
MLDISGLIATWRPTLDTAARNAWGLSFGDGVEKAERTPSVLISEGPHRDLYRFGALWTPKGKPVLLVPPLAVSADCYDLRSGQSLAAHLLGGGNTPYLLDYGTMRYSDRGMGFEAWVDDIIPEAIRSISDLHDGAAVSVIGWSLGGTMSLLTSSAHPDLRVASITAIGTPIDYTKIPAISPLRLIGKYTGDTPLTSATNLVGGLPAPLVQASYKVTALQREVLKPWFIVRNLHDTETLARMESIDKFMAAMPGYPGKAFQQICEQLMLGNNLFNDAITLAGREIKLSALKVPVLAIGGTTDVIAPIASAEAITSVLTGAPSVRFEEAPGSHLGLVAGPTARDSTWTFIDEFLKENAPQLVSTS